MYRSFGKRFFDFILGVFLLLCLWPLLLLIAVLIKVTSKGPVFFCQERAGSGGSYFTMLKFRSMAVDPDAEKKGFEPGTAKRITWIGRIIRKTKLDELPQVFHVVSGKMSLIGPRPEVRPYIELYPERWERVLSVPPGISDPASIKFRNEEELLRDAEDPEEEYRSVILPHKLDLYEDYVQNISLITDAKLCFATIFTVLLK